MDDAYLLGDEEDCLSEEEQDRLSEGVPLVGGEENCENDTPHDSHPWRGCSDVNGLFYVFDCPGQ